MLQSQYPAAMSQVHFWAIAPGYLKGNAQHAAFTSGFNGFPIFWSLKLGKLLGSPEAEQIERPSQISPFSALIWCWGCHFGSLRASLPITERGSRGLMTTDSF